MRDIVVTAAVMFSLVLTFYNPFIGVLAWHWLGLMNPHMLCWGFAAGAPFAMLVALATLASLLINKKEPKQIPWVAITKVLAVFWAWMLVTTFFALNQTDAWHQWDKVWKIQLFVFVTLILLTSRARIEALVWIMAVSLGLYGVKGGIFTLVTGGGYHVMGPAHTFIGGNNEIGLALIMTIPLMRYLQLQAATAWLKYAMMAAIGFTFVAIVGTQSRGALVGVVAMTLYLVMKSRKRGVLILLLVMFLPLLFLFMPESWHARMSTIETYEEDASAMGRINAWWFAWNLAVDRPLVGGGFEAFRGWLFSRYAPNPLDYHDAHSIYFEILGEQGFVGLALFLGLGVAALMTTRSIVRQTKDDPRLFWMRDLASMIQVSLVGYAVAGAFLGLGYFNFYYGLLAVVVGMQRLLAKYATEGIPEEPAPTPMPGLRSPLAPAGAGGAPHPAFWQINPFQIRRWLQRL